MGLYSSYLDPGGTGTYVDDPGAPANLHAEPLCRCDQVQPDDGSRAHCFQSREETADAMGGGGHFFSSALFNEHPADGLFEPLDCWFAYPKQGWRWSTLGNDLSFLELDASAPVFHYCSNVKPNGDLNAVEMRLPHMETFCIPGSGTQDLDVGVERDWLSLYWSLYADDRGASGDHRFSVGDILTSFGDGNSGHINVADETYGHSVLCVRQHD